MSLKCSATLKRCCFLVLNKVKSFLKGKTKCDCGNGVNGFLQVFLHEYKLTLKKKLFHSVSSLTVGWRGPLSRHGGAPQRSSDAVAPHHRQALPHPAVWMLQSWHSRGCSWGSAEPGCRQLEGNARFKMLFKNVCLVILYLSNINCRIIQPQMSIQLQVYMCLACPNTQWLCSECRDTLY